ncbi:putative baseplate assembly protein [Ramlibacter sp. XY19]|uniref:putative baseplate assembly protein n=1 Tax=Ramlibacter paludis TaxID=2908000 RepID=UPI0023DC7796|nr:putative baseplate assembly protein [Ramlibacter paludis]MCG2593189.1 putative baseplate assembly protein [Ramlibacter paludis]
MPLIAPVLDDRSFEDLFLELRNRIPVYTPEWTDHHDSDVGITLLQLFAYLGEGLQFRFNQIPEATHLAFLKLLDVPLRPARAARALLRFESKQAAGVRLYAGDQAKAGKVLFTLEQELTVWPLDCVAVARRSLLSEEELAQPGKVAEYIAHLDPGVRTTVQASVDAIQLAQGEGETVAPYETVTMGSDGKDPAIDFSNTVDQCVWIAVLAPKDPPIAPAMLADPVQGLKRVAGQPLPLSIGFSPKAWFPTLDEAPACGQPAPTLQWQASLAQAKADGSVAYRSVRVAGDTTQGFTSEGTVRLELPVDLAVLGAPAAPAGLAGTGTFPPELDDDRAQRLWFWLRAWRSDGSRIGEVQLLTLNAAPCVQVAAAAAQLLGTGTGQPDQVYRLADAPVVLDARYPVEVQVEEQGTWTDWLRVENFDASGAGDAHFSVDAEAGTVRFGARAPQLGERIRVNRYHTSRGAAGNVPPQAIDKIGATLSSPVPLAPLRRPDAPPGVKLSNPLRAYGGVDNESLDAALRRIPTELRRNWRAVCQDDFASLALETPGLELARAECLPLFHAPSRERKPGCVSVVVWPARDPQHPDAPLPDAWELAQVCGWLDRWRLVTTELYVIPPTYRRIAVAVSVKVREGFGLDAVRDWVEMLLRQYLAPLPPHGPDGRGWPLGRRVLARELEGAAMQVEGVEYIQSLRLDFATPTADGKGETWSAIDVLKLADWEVPALAAVTVVDDQTELPAPGTGLAPPPTRPPVAVPVMKEVC